MGFARAGAPGGGQRRAPESRTPYESGIEVHFDLVDVRLLVNIAEANSLTGGAERSHLSAPAASARIRNLEESLGTRLLVRSHQGVTLTPPGQSFVHHARQVLRQFERLRGDLQAYTKGLKGQVRLFANTTATTEFLPAALSSFLAAHPDVNVELREKLSHDIVRAVSDGTADIGLVAGPVRTEGLQVIPWRRDRLVLATPPGHALAGRDSIGFDEALDFDCVGLPEASAIHHFLAREAEACGRALKTRVMVGNFEAMCRMVEAGVGIGVLPESSARRHARTMRLHVAQLADAWAVRDLRICVRSLALLPGFARALVEVLQAGAEPAAP